jgi:predicted O-methyltransferase YrrM
MSKSRLIDALLTGEPYFGPAMRALQGPPARHKYFLPLVKAIAETNVSGQIRIFEIGSWAGASTVTWARAIQKLRREGRITCVDRWQPYFDVSLDTEPHYREMNEAAENGKIFKLFLHNIEAAKVSNMVDYFVGNARDILPKCPSNMVDIVYIDGSHVYESVRADIQDAKRLVRDGGIVCGDDLELQKHEVESQEHRAAVKLQKDYVYSSKATKHYHPGVTEAVAVEFGEVSAWEGIWAMRRVGSQWARIDLAIKKAQIPPHIAGAVAAIEVTEVGQTRDFKLFNAGVRFLAVAKSLGLTDLLVERLGERELPPVLFSGESLEEARRKAVAVEKETFPPAERVDETSGFNLVRIKGRFLAVAKRLGPIELFSERLGERELVPLLYSGESLQEVREKAYAFERERAVPAIELVDEVGGYNVVKAGERFIAVAKELGPVNVFHERLGERELSPIFLTGDSLEEVRKKALLLEEEARPVGELIGETREFNLIKIRGRFLAAAKSIGPTDFLVERLGERELAPILFTGESLEEAREKALSFEGQRALPEVELIEEIGDYNIVKSAEHFIAIAKKLGPVNLFKEQLGERELPPFILIATDLSTLRQRITEPPYCSQGDTDNS